MSLCIVGYTTTDVIYRWNKERPAVAIAEDMKLSQFDLVDCPAGNITDVVYKAAAPNNQIAIDEYNYKNAQQQQQQLLLQQQQQQYFLQQQPTRHQDPSKNTKIVTTYTGPAAKNQHVRGAGIQLDKGAFSGGKQGQSVHFEVAQTCKFVWFVKGNEKNFF